MWAEVGNCLEKFGVKNPIKVLQQELDMGDQPKESAKPIPVNKLGDYCEGEEGNTTLPVEYNGVNTKAILDSGRLRLSPNRRGKNGESLPFGAPEHLADGSLESRIGLLETALVKSCRIEYEHTFAIVDFGKETNYEVILGDHSCANCE